MYWAMAMLRVEKRALSGMLPLYQADRSLEKPV